MKILITGICGFVGRSVAEQLLQQFTNLELYGLDNFIRPGSELNRADLIQSGVKIFHADIRNASDMEMLPEVDWVIDAAANPSVLAGVDGKTSSRQLIEHNLGGTINILEYCKRVRAGFILLSTSRVYSIPGIADLEVEVHEGAYRPVAGQDFALGISVNGVSEAYSTQAPVSLYGSTKVASEVLALEYGATFDLPVWVNRCGVLAGAGQFGRPDQGIFAYWTHSWKQQRPLKYIGFDGMGHQVRDCLHPQDLAAMLRLQINCGQDSSKPAIVNLAGGVGASMSLRQLSDWCANRFGPLEVATEPKDRPFDIPWMVLDSSLAKAQWGWRPKRGVDSILEEIAQHAEANPDWLKLSAPY
jgi:CDP-paratose 2-epimerase